MNEVMKLLCLRQTVKVISQADAFAFPLFINKNCFSMGPPLTLWNAFNTTLKPFFTVTCTSSSCVISPLLKFRQAVISGPRIGGVEDLFGCLFKMRANMLAKGKR